MHFSSVGEFFISIFFILIEWLEKFMGLSLFFGIFPFGDENAWKSVGNSGENTLILVVCFSEN
jgi:hypothetical protein